MNHDIWSIWFIWYGEIAILYGNNPHLWQKEKWRASMKNQENHMPTYNSKAESKSALWKDNPLASIRKMEVSTWKLNHENCERIEWKSHSGRFCTSRSIIYLYAYWVLDCKKIQKNVFLSPSPLLMYSTNVKDSENADRWLAALFSSIVH